MGQCPGCGEWNTLVEEARGKTAPKPRATAKPLRLADVQAPRYARLHTGIGELDRILGGGLVPGSLVLIGGSPGIGKSTLTSMALGNLEGPATARSTSPARSPRRRSGCAPSGCPAPRSRSPFWPRRTSTRCSPRSTAERPEVCVIDSVQTLHAADLSGAAG